MNINAINSILSCQPLKQVNFAKKQPKTPVEAPIEQTQDTCDIDKTTLEQKYDLACRLAAYYKTQYEQLLKTGSVVA